MGPKRNLKRNRFALIVLAALLLACNLSRLRPGSSNSSSNNNRGVSTSTKGSQPSDAFNPAGDARQNLKDAFLRMKTAYPYRLTETMTFAASNRQAMPTTIRVAEFAAPDRVHTKLNGEEVGITFGDKHYTYVKGKWVDTGAPVRASGANMEKMLASSLKEVQPAGEETVNGVPCFAYTARFEWTVSNQPSVGTGKTWIGLADGLPHQIDGDWKVANYDTKSHIVYEYNVEIRVDKPVP